PLPAWRPPRRHRGAAPGDRGPAGCPREACPPGPPPHQVGGEPHLGAQCQLGPGSVRAEGPVVLDLQAIQNRDYAERGVARHTFEFARALAAAHPDLVGAMVLNPDLPSPGGIDELRATGKVAWADAVEVSGACIYHVIA